jgi:hypothetical protein
MPPMQASFGVPVQRWPDCNRTLHEMLRVVQSAANQQRDSHYGCSLPIHNVAYAHASPISISGKYKQAIRQFYGHLYRNIPVCMMGLSAG